MKKYLVAVLLLAVTHLATAQIPVDSIKAIIKREVAAKRSKSIIVGITDGKNTQIFAEGIKSDDDPVLPDGNTIYEIGSITKAFTSMLLADMSLKNELSVNDPVSKFLPKHVKAPVRNGKEVSLLNLATHTSGMPRFPYNMDAKNIDKPCVDYSTDLLYEYVSNFEPPFDIGSKWKYSNVAYGLLGTILATVTQKDYEALIVERICKPLNMNNTCISLTAKQKANSALGHLETGTAVGFIDLGAIEAGGGLRSNVDDMLTFAEAHMGFIKTELFPAMELTHMARARTDGDDSTAMGWTLSGYDGKSFIFKDGGMPGYRSFLGIDRVNKIAVIVFANTSNSVTDIGRHILDSARHIQPYKYPWAVLDTLRSTVKTQGVDAAIELYRQLKASKNTSFIFNESQLNYLGTELRRKKKIKVAIKIFELNAAEYPKSTIVYESLAETHKRNKNKKLGIQYFEKAQELDPNNPRWPYLIKKLKS